MNPLLTGGAGLVVVIFLLVLAVLWFCLPFAVFGSKPRLDRVIAAAEKQNALLIDLIAEMRQHRRADSAEPGAPKHWTER